MAKKGNNPNEQNHTRYIGGRGRDGKQDWPTRISRDNRATGLRTHKTDRKAAKDSMKADNGDSLPSGKRRRYSDRYGYYLL